MINELEVLLSAMQEAGDAILKLQQTGFTVAKKANNDIVTQADLLANTILTERLNARFPAYGWLSEESVDNDARLTCEKVWIIDPIDGTKEYASGIPEYAISVALVENGQPVLAAVFNPAVNELYHAVKGQGAWLHDKLLHCDVNEMTETCTLLASRSEYQRGEWDRFNQHKVKPIGSIAYKLALIASGHGHATFSLGPKNEWDIAAGVLLVTEAGGFVSDKDQHPFLFNKKQVKVNGVIAADPRFYSSIHAMIQAS